MIFNILKTFNIFLKNYGKNKIGSIFLFSLLSIVSGALEILGIILVYPFCISLTKPEILLTNKYCKLIFDNLYLNTISKITVFTLILIVLCFVLKNLLTNFTTYHQNKFIFKWKNELSSKFMTYYLFASYKDNTQTSASEKIYNLTILIGQVLDGYVLSILNILSNTIICLMILSLLVIKLPIETITTLAFIVIGLTLQKKFFKKKLSNISAELAKTSADNNNSIMECIKNFKEVKVLGIENYFYKKFSENKSKHNQTMLKSNYYTLIQPRIVEIILIISCVIFSSILIINYLDNNFQIICLLSIAGVSIFRILPLITGVKNSLNQINSTTMLMDKINEYAKIYKFEEKDLPELDVKLPPLTFKDSLKLDGINFQYVENKPVIKNLDLEIKSGEFVGILGEAGSGKTTLVEIIMGLLPINYGNITLDDIFINQRNFFSMRKIIGYVPQNLNIIDGTFAQNVAWGNEEEEIDYKAVVMALRKTKLLKDIQSLDKGVDEKIIGLTQGQKQRLGIARALYRNPEILILDAVTSTLDKTTEDEVMEILKEFKRKKTIISVTNKESMLKMCDRIIYLKNGEIIDIGTYKELITLYEEIKNLIKTSNIKN